MLKLSLQICPRLVYLQNWPPTNPLVVFLAVIKWLVFQYNQLGVLRLVPKNPIAFWPTGLLKRDGTWFGFVGVVGLNSIPKGDAVLCEDITTKTKNHFKHILAPLQKPIVTNYQYLGVLESSRGWIYQKRDCWVTNFRTLSSTNWGGKYLMILRCVFSFLNNFYRKWLAACLPTNAPWILWNSLLARAHGFLAIDNTWACCSMLVQVIEVSRLSA